MSCVFKAVGVFSMILPFLLVKSSAAITNKVDWKILLVDQRLQIFALNGVQIDLLEYVFFLHLFEIQPVDLPLIFTRLRSNL